MWKRIRQNLKLVWGTIGTVALLLIVVLAWKSGWMPVQFVEPETGTLAESDLDWDFDESPKPSATGSRSQDEDEPEFDSSIFSAQSEPNVSDEPDFESYASSSDRRSAETQLAERWEDQPFPETPSRRTSPNPSGPARATTEPLNSAMSPFSNNGSFSNDGSPESRSGTASAFDDRPHSGDREGSPFPRSQPMDSNAARRPSDSRFADAPVPRNSSSDAGRIVQVGNEAGSEAEAERNPRGTVRTADDAIASDPPQSDVLAQIDELLEAGDYLTAHRELSKLYWNRTELRDTLQSRIEATAKSIYFDPQPHYMQPYVIEPNDQLRLIARQYKVPWEYLAKLNRTDPRRIRPGQKLKVIKGPFAAVVDLRRFELTVHAHGYFVARYPVGIGKDGTTPIGKFTVLTKLVNPKYYGPDGNVIEADDPENPLGERWIDLGDSYGIHGTIEPDSIGKAESRGCIRLLNEHVEEVYDFLEIGSEVIIRR